MPIDPNQVQWDAPPAIDASKVQWDEPKRETTMAEDVSQGALNLLSGAVRGAGSIGATILAPYDMAKDAIAGKGLSLDANMARRAEMDAALGSAGAQGDSLMYRGGKLASEIAGTSGIGGLLAKPVQAVADLSLQAGAASPLLNAVARGLETGGFRTGPGLGSLANVLTRAGTGAAVGGAAAGMVNPEDAGMGALIGGALPVTTQLVGSASERLDAVLGGSKQPNSRLLDTAKQSIEAGYVIPPNMVQPSFKNQVIESVSGKMATQQLASTRNTDVTEGLVRQALGIADDVPLTQGTMENLRKTAGKAYAEVSNLSPQAATDLEALKVARNESQGWFKAYNRSARPDDLAKAKDARTLATQLEQALETHAKDAGRPELVPALREARKEIAKTYTVGRALNDAAGTVDARVLGRMHEKGLPLSDGLDVAGQFASAFPTVAKSPQQIGSPAAHNLKAVASMALGAGGGMSAGLAGLPLAALPFITPPIARAMMFSKPAQQGLLGSLAPIMGEAAPMGLLGQFGYRAAPVLLAQ